MISDTTSNVMRHKGMLLLLGKLLRTKEPDIEPEIDKKKVSILDDS